MFCSNSDSNIGKDNVRGMVNNLDLKRSRRDMCCKYTHEVIEFVLYLWNN